MFGLGFTEILVILVVALLVLGPEKLPGVARSIGKTLGQFQRGLDEFKRELIFPRLDDSSPPVPPKEIVRLGPRGDTCESKKVAPAVEGSPVEGAALEDASRQESIVTATEESPSKEPTTE